LVSLRDEKAILSLTYFVPSCTEPVDTI
jgi:hypothetical protein